MKELKDQIIKKVELGDEDTSIVFTTDKDKEIVFYADGDCCSFSWFAHISGIKNILGHTITKIDDSKYLTPQEEAEKDGSYESLAVYGYDLHSDIGICTIEFRNESNGYYGGSVYHADNRVPNAKYKEIKEDF